MADKRIDTFSDTWSIVKAKAEKELESARSRLETSGHSIEKTEYERGRIKAYREILDLASPRTVIPE